MGEPILGRQLAVFRQLAVKGKKIYGWHMWVLF